MCVYTTKILNKKYLPNKKNNFNPPKCPNEKFRWVEIACGKCYECRKKKSREWNVRLQEEIKNKMCDFVTFTISNEFLDEIANNNMLDIQTLDENLYNNNLNKIATIAMRDFLEKYRKKWKVSLKHWCITERGTKGSERIHIHGIMIEPLDRDYKKYWKFGHIFVGQWVNAQTINYIIKYMLKGELANNWFTGKVLCSPGIGKDYIKRAGENKFKGEQTREYYRFENGSRMSLPKYYREKIYTEDEKFKLWEYRIDKDEYYIGGNKIVGYKENEIMALRKEYQKRYINIHGDRPHEWDFNKTELRLERYRKRRYPTAAPLNERGQKKNNNNEK